MNEVVKKPTARELRAELKQTFIKLAETEDVQKQADFRLKGLRIQKKLKEVESGVDKREYVTSKHVAGYCMNCEIPVSAYNEDRIEENGVVYCCQGCQAHYEELAGHKKAAASWERNRQSNHFFNTYTVILSKTQHQIKLG